MLEAAVREEQRVDVPCSSLHSTSTLCHIADYWVIQTYDLTQ